MALTFSVELGAAQPAIHDPMLNASARAVAARWFRLVNAGNLSDIVESVSHVGHERIAIESPKRQIVLQRAVEFAV